MKMRKACALLPLLGLLASCHQAPIKSPPIAGYPCGVMGILCDTGKCCDRDQSCGIPNTVSAGMCRFTGGDEMESAATRGGPVMTPQWLPRS